MSQFNILIIGSVNNIFELRSVTMKKCDSYFFNTITKKFSQDSSLDVLLSGSIYAIKKDTDGNIWFTSDYNLYKFKPENKEFNCSV